MACGMRAPESWGDPHVTRAAFGGGCFPDDSRRCSQVKLGSAADFLLDISETDLSTLTASIKAPSGRDEPCLLKRLPNNHIGEPRPPSWLELGGRWAFPQSGPGQLVAH